MKKLRCLVFGFCLVLLLQACSSGNHEFQTPGTTELIQVFSPVKENALAPHEYVSWVEDPANGLVKSKEVDECIYKAYYKPLPYVVLRDWEEGKELSKPMYDSAMKEYDGLQYYTFTIEGKPEVTGNQELLRYKISRADEYVQRVEYYSFNVQNDMRLVEGADTLVCRMCHFERAYGLQPKIKIIAAFDRKPVLKGKKKEESYQDDKVFEFYDRVFGAGIVKLPITKETLISIPDLKIG